jgi:ADP-ribosylation factor family
MVEVFIILRGNFLGFNVETVEYKNISFTVWDVGGQDKVILVLSADCPFLNYVLLTLLFILLHVIPFVYVHRLFAILLSSYG